MNWRLSIISLFAVAALCIGPVTAYAQGPPLTLPDLTVCDGITDACEAPDSVCSSGFRITLVEVNPANFSETGTATYHYRICDAHLIVGEENCPADPFRELSHFDVTFPKLGGTCLGTGTQISGTCTAVDNTPGDNHAASVGGFGPGDAVCFEKTCGGVQGGTSCNNAGDCTDNPDGESCVTGGSNFVAKCDETDIGPGDCIEMTITIAGELTGLGVGATVVVDKEATTCTGSCLAGPSCDSCGEPLDGEACLTRTRGFWGTHPHIADLYDPVTVCGTTITGTAANSCSTSEALCTSAKDYKQNPQYLELVAQLTAAKLNLNATAALAVGATCSGFRFNEETILQIIARCDSDMAAICNGSKATISNSGCIEALDAFNNSQDTGFDETPSPFDSPGPAQPEQCQLARGNGKAIGKNSTTTCP